jgi:hypothetical protein
MVTGPQCQVERCKFPATAMQRLKERSGAFDFRRTWPSAISIGSSFLTRRRNGSCLTSERADGCSWVPCSAS